MQKKLKLSASSISAYKCCPFRFRNAYVLGIRSIESTDAQRIGTSWHEILEVASLEPGGWCPECYDHVIESFKIDETCPICAGTGKVPEDVMEAVVRVLNKAYADVPLLNKAAKDLERTRLLYALVGYRWYYGSDFEPSVMREEYFKLPLLNPTTGHPVPNVTLEGKIDKIVNLLGEQIRGVKEHKTTSSSLDSDSSFWSHLNMDTQTSLYIYAARRLQLAGELEKFGIKASDPLISKISYDVHRKPKTTPKAISQKASKEFVETSMYCGQEFTVEVTYVEGDDTPVIAMAVNGEIVEVEPGKKAGTYAIRETCEMYGARLLEDITQRPKYFFEQKELVRTDAEMAAFEFELYDIAKDMQSKIRADRWWHNEFACEATFKCDYCDSCYNHIPLDVNNPPTGMKWIFKPKEEKSND